MDDSATNWYDPEFATFGDRLAAARDASGMSQEVLAKRLGVKLATLSKWEDDMAEPRANRLAMMSGLLGVSISWLLTGAGEGLDNPGLDTDDDSPQKLLLELRELRASFAARGEQLGRIEKRLRKLIAEDQIG